MASRPMLCAGIMVFNVIYPRLDSKGMTAQKDLHQSGQCSASETRSANSRYSNCYTFVSTRCQRIRDIGTRLILSRSRVWRDEIHWNVNTWRNIAAGVRHRAVQFGRLDASLIPTVLFSSLKHIRLCTTAM